MSGRKAARKQSPTSSVDEESPAEPWASEGQLSPRQALFVQEYLVTLNATKAYQTVYEVGARVAATNGWRLLRKADVAAAVRAGMEARAIRIGITQDAVMRDMWEIAQADPNQLIQHRRSCCRYCHGINHQWQYTPRELKSAREQHEQRVKELAEKATRKSGRPALRIHVTEEAAPLTEAPAFDEKGGAGWDPRRDPHPDCPECFGEGVASVFLPDSRRVTGAARRLYAGVKVTDKGVEVQMRNQDANLVQVARHLGMLRDKVEHTGKDGGPIHTKSEPQEFVIAGQKLVFM